MPTQLLEINPIRIGLKEDTQSIPTEPLLRTERSLEGGITRAPLKVRLRVKPGLASRRGISFVSIREQETQRHPEKEPYLREIRKYPIKLEISDSSSSEAETDLILGLVKKGKTLATTPQKEKETVDGRPVREPLGAVTPPEIATSGRAGVPSHHPKEGE